MRYYRLAESNDSRLVAQTDESAYDLTAARDGLRSYTDPDSAAAISNASIDAIADGLLSDATELERRLSPKPRRVPSFLTKCGPRA